MTTYRLTEGIRYYGGRARNTIQELFNQVTCRFPCYSALEAAAVTQEGRITNIQYGGSIGDLRERILEMWGRVLYAKGKSEHPANRGVTRRDKKPVKPNGKLIGNGVTTVKGSEGRWLRTRGT